MLSRRILTLSLLLVVVAAYLIFFEGINALFPVLGLGLLGAMIAYVFQHQLNSWWFRKHPPSFPEPVHAMFLRNGQFYRNLEGEDLQSFQIRSLDFVERREFLPMGVDTFPEDVKFMLAYYAVMVGFYRKQSRYSPYDRVVLYLHPFLSPNFPEQVHAYEAEDEDGTLIFSLEQLNAGFVQPGKFYQTGLHLFAELLIQKYKPSFAEAYDNKALWEIVSQCGEWTAARIEDFTGMVQQDPRPVLIHHWFAMSDSLRAADPSLYAKISAYLGAK